MQIFVGTGAYKVLYPAPIKLNYAFNCKDEKLSSLLNLKTKVTVIYFKNYESGLLNLIVPRVSDKYVTLDIKLTEIFALTSDFAWCKTQMTSY
jgi:hypothetical protein